MTQLEEGNLETRITISLKGPDGKFLDPITLNGEYKNQEFFNYTISPMSPSATNSVLSFLASILKDISIVFSKDYPEEIEFID